MSSFETVRTAARRTPLVQTNVRAFAAEHDASTLRDAFPGALTEVGLHVATVLAVAAAHRGARLGVASVRELLPELDSIELFGPLVFAADGDPVDVLVGFLEDGAGSWERETLAVLLAAEELGGKPAPVRLLAQARRIARRRIGAEAGAMLGAAAIQLGDPHFDALAGHCIALARRSPVIARTASRNARRSAIEAVSAVAPPKVSSGYTVRKELAANRNDPCPCGSGKKYKKCCLDKPDETPFEPPSIDPAAVSVEQIEDLRPGEIVSIDPRRLGARARIAAFRRLTAFRRWSQAERFLEAILVDTKNDEIRDDWHEELIEAARSAGAYDVVERHVALLPESRRDERLRLLLECMQPPPDLIARLNEHARSALADPDGEHAFTLAFSMLDQFPALGIFVARGALTTARLLDSDTLLEHIEEARDTLGIEPFEPWWDVWEKLSDEDDASESEADVEQIRGELRRAREKADEATTEAKYLQRRLKELESAPPIAAKPPSSPALAPAPNAEDEKKRLRTKVAELQRIISEGRDERRALRQQLAEKVELIAPASGAPPMIDEGDEGDDADRPRRVLVPTFAPRASKALADLTADIAELALVRVAELAAGSENAWRGVKRLRVRDVLSARAGIHYRVLFRIADGALEVRHVVHRRDLEAAIASLDS